MQVQSMRGLFKGQTIQIIANNGLITNQIQLWLGHHWVAGQDRSWVQVLVSAESLPVSFISLGAGTAEQAISQ